MRILANENFPLEAVESLRKHGHDVAWVRIDAPGSSDLDMKAARITINRVKGSMIGTYPLSPDTVKLIRSYLKIRKDVSPYLFISNRALPIDRRTLLAMMKKYGTAAGIPKEKQQFHALKHSIGTHILDAGEDVYFAKDWLGHKNIQNTTIDSKFSTGTRVRCEGRSCRFG